MSTTTTKTATTGEWCIDCERRPPTEDCFRNHEIARPLHTNECVRQRAKFGARSKAGDVCSCGADAGLRLPCKGTEPNTATVTDYCECGHAPYAHFGMVDKKQCLISGCGCALFRHHAEQPSDPAELSGDLPVIASHIALLDVLEAAKLLLAMNNCNYDRDQMRRSGGFDQLQEAVTAVEKLRQARGGE